MDYRELISDFRATLNEATEHRLERQLIDPTTGDPGWVSYERRVMFDRVNQHLADIGLPAVTGEQLLRVENQACGHSDYVLQYAIGCANLVTDAGRAVLDACRED